MKAVDYRNETWASIRGRIVEDMERVYQAYVKHGPGTTRETAAKAGISLWTFRPRNTDLVKLGFLEVMEGRGNGKDGVYIAIPFELVESRFEHWREKAIHGELKFQ
jgi:hypothetical protein